MCVCVRKCVYILVWNTITTACIVIEYAPVSKLTFDHSRWQVSRVKQETLTLPEHLVPHPLQGALNCIGYHWLDIYILLMLCVH